MAETSKIEWTDATWNPITGCTLVSEGCKFCYAARLAATRLKNHPSRKGLARLNAAGEAKFTGEVRFNEQWLDQPLRWRRPRRIFVCAHGDLFHEAVPDEWIDRVFAVMALAPQHQFQCLTKRPERARAYLDNVDYRSAKIAQATRGLSPEGEELWLTIKARMPFANVWLGTSVEDQATADERIPHLLETPAAVRFLSYEPALGPVDLTLDGLSCWPCPHCADASPEWDTGVVECRRCDSTGKGDEIGLDWVIAGGESGPGARPAHPDWFRTVRAQCAAAGVPFHFKQHGAWLHESQDLMGKWDWADADDRGILHLWPDNTASIPIGKTAAGREIDGRTHDEFPEVTA